MTRVAHEVPVVVIVCPSCAQDGGRHWISRVGGEFWLCRTASACVRACVRVCLLACLLGRDVTSRGTRAFGGGEGQTPTLDAGRPTTRRPKRQGRPEEEKEADWHGSEGATQR